VTTIFKKQFQNKKDISLGNLNYRM